MGSQMRFGVDVGGTFIKFGMFSEEGECQESWKVPTGDTACSNVLATVVREIRTHAQSAGCKWEDIGGVGMGVPGSVNEKGIVISAPNLGWSMTDVRTEAKEFFPMPLKIVNDANAAALGEQFCGSGKGCSSMVFVTLGTGVGGGVIMDGKLVCGAFNGAGEIGHMPVNPSETRVCTCKNRGCLEQYASATGIAAMAQRLLEQTNQKSLLRAHSAVTAKEVFEAVKKGDALAKEVAESFGEVLGRALAMVAAVADPQVFVIGGGVSAAGTVLLDYIEPYYRKYAFAPSKQTPLRIASLGNEAGLYGAARLVMPE